MATEYKLARFEMETQVLYNQTNEPVIISGYDPKLLRHLADYAERHPDLCRRVDKRRYPDYAEYEVQKDRVSIRLKEPASEAQKLASAEKMRKLHESKKNTDQTQEEE